MGAPTSSRLPERKAAFSLGKSVFGYFVRIQSEKDKFKEKGWKEGVKQERKEKE